MEEDEEVLYKQYVFNSRHPFLCFLSHSDIFRRAKLFRFDPDLKQWKERGTGDVKFLKHKDSKKIRVLMRREKTLKLCANHFSMLAVILFQLIFCRIIPYRLILWLSSNRSPSLHRSFTSAEAATKCWLRSLVGLDRIGL